MTCNFCDEKPPGSMIKALETPEGWVCARCKRLIIKDIVPIPPSIPTSKLPLELTNPISSDAIHRKWPIYSSQVHDRLIIGAEAYGDSSFKKSINELLAEIEQELLDVSGWAFILWCKVLEMQQKIKEEGAK